MDDLARFCCQNSDCSLYGRRDAGNLSVCALYGRQKQFRLLYCNACRARFSERKGTALFRCRLPDPTAQSVFDHLAEGNGIRQTGRLVGVAPNTVVRLARACGLHAHDAHDELVAVSPQTREVQFDEKWAFVGKKQKNCDPTDPADEHKGDYWDHVAFDPEHRLVLAVVPGARSIENAEEIVAEVKDRVGPEPPRLTTSDEYSAYASALEAAYAEPVAPPSSPRPGRPPILPPRQAPATLVDATVRKQRQNNRVVAVHRTVVLGTESQVAEALEASAVSTSINTSFVERQHGTDRGQNARKSRRTYRFSKDWRVHEAMTYYTLYRYNFCWPVRTLRVAGADGRWQRRTPAMAAGLADHVWTPMEWLSFPAIQSN